MPSVSRPQCRLVPNRLPVASVFLACLARQRIPGPHQARFKPPATYVRRDSSPIVRGESGCKGTNIQSST